MRKRVQWQGILLAVGLTAVPLSGCGTGDGDTGGTGSAIVIGMTDEVTATDPASGYDIGSWLVFNNVFQTLLSFPKGSLTPRPEAAKRCSFSDAQSTVYTCTLRDSLQFSNGNALTSKDVKHSFERTRKIADDNGPAHMLQSIKSISTPDQHTVVFQLKYPDATFPQKIASGAGAIVDHRVYPKDRLLEDHKAVGSGVYTLDRFTDDEAVFLPNGKYDGPARLKNSGMTVKFFDGDQDALKRAVEKGDVDIAYRGLSAQAIADLESSPAGNEHGIKVVEGTSAGVMHLVFNMDDPTVAKDGVRTAIAYLIDRNILVRDVHKRTAEPLYSIVPAGITGHNTAYFDRYGERPQYGKAAEALKEEGITEKVELTLWSTPNRFGPATGPAFEKIAQQLNASGLFEAKVGSADWPVYEKAVEAGKYAVYARGWVPDYPDPDSFTAPFFGTDNVLNNNYDAEHITDRLMPPTFGEDNRAATVDDFEKLQDYVAEELPLIPLWQDKQYAVARENVDGLQWTLDASTIFRFWEIGKGTGA